MSDTQYIRMSLAIGVVLGVVISASGEVALIALVVASAVGLAVWSIWSNER